MSFKILLQIAAVVVLHGANSNPAENNFASAIHIRSSRGSESKSKSERKIETEDKINAIIKSLYLRGSLSNSASSEQPHYGGHSNEIKPPEDEDQYFRYLEDEAPSETSRYLEGESPTQTFHPTATDQPTKTFWPTEDGEQPTFVPTTWVPTPEDWASEDEKSDSSDEDTPAPTNPPTTMSPTAIPTKTPTQSPIQNGDTAAPTNTNTDANTDTTTKPPTKSPTEAPTKKPTTQSPTKQGDTRAPTKSPTKAPSRAPTHEPTQSPTKKGDTRAPTKPPTNAPTTKSPTKDEESFGDEGPGPNDETVPISDSAPPPIVAVVVPAPDSEPDVSAPDPFAQLLPDFDRNPAVVRNINNNNNNNSNPLNNGGDVGAQLDLASSRLRRPSLLFQRQQEAEARKTAIVV